MTERSGEPTWLLPGDAKQDAPVPCWSLPIHHSDHHLASDNLNGSMVDTCQFEPYSYHSKKHQFPIHTISCGIYEIPYEYSYGIHKILTAVCSTQGTYDLCQSCLLKMTKLEQSL